MQKKTHHHSGNVHGLHDTTAGKEDVWLINTKSDQLFKYRMNKTICSINDQGRT
jgi:hypothetical protein